MIGGGSPSYLPTATSTEAELRDAAGMSPEVRWLVVSVIGDPWK